ncbi:Zn(II)2Cys6 transcription factor domain-containing protein [Aspergillus melleus]|uniref:Zn(II)2Cys6 transcription factor domain-containing protein n=1 Tax=Aspergillus melleus TaxID=138277 RepID=UPI001E8EB1FE|nr:uncharacterized protein LDX57_007636 [Aspergillus melleus]KAH8429964.1 hypothetical protein LDX57_007636 [Aspergillus melleus]
MNPLTPQGDLDAGSRNPKPVRRHACDRCRSQKLRCDRTTHTDPSIACDRCARNNLTCVIGATMPMGRPRSLNHKPRYRRTSSKKSDEMRSNETRADSSDLPSCPPDLAMAGMDAINELPDPNFDHGTMAYDLNFPNMNVFDTIDFADLATNLQPDVVGSTDFPTVSPKEQNIERMWKLHSTLLQHVYHIESQAAFTNDFSPDTHSLGSRLSDITNTQSDHPMHQMMRCSQTFLEIIQSFVTSHRECVCSIPTRDQAATDWSRDSDDAGDKDDEDELIYHSNYRPSSASTHDTSSWFTLPTLDNPVTTSPARFSTGRNRAWPGGRPEKSSNSQPDKKLQRSHPALPPECQTQFPICLTLTTCHVLFIRLHRSVLTDLHATIRSLVAQYTPVGDLTGPLAVLDNLSGSAPFNVHLDGPTLKLDGVQQIRTLLQLSCDLLERIDRGVEILLTGAGHLLSAPGTYMSILEALAQQEARSGRGPAMPDGMGSIGGRAARLAPSRMLARKIRKCIDDTCL